MTDVLTKPDTGRTMRVRVYFGLNSQLSLSDPHDLGSRPFSACSNDACVAVIDKDSARWRLLATRSAYRIDWDVLTSSCEAADIAVSDRRLPRGCHPRWLKLDPQSLRRTGGLAIYLGSEPRVDSVADRVGAHPWAETTR